MYKILFHVASIAILEIAFFFYYIGPKETEMFLIFIERILKDPVFNNMNLNLPIPIGPPINYLNTTSSINYSMKDILYILIQPEVPITDGSSTLYQRLHDDRLQGIEEREIHNDELFWTAVNYWLIIFTIGLFSFLLHHQYTKYQANKLKNKIVPILSDSGLDNMEMTAYRKTSIHNDDPEMQSQIPQNEIPKSQKKGWNEIGKIGGNYILFGGCIISFQYVFFQYIAFKYQPLSIEEIKYYLYLYFFPQIQS